MKNIFTDGISLYFAGDLYVLPVDFPAGVIRILKPDSALAKAQTHALIPLSQAEDCCNQNSAADADPGIG